jgi:hypothetical protein
MQQQALSKELKDHLKTELCADDSKYTLPDIDAFIDECDCHYKVSRKGNVIINYIYPSNSEEIIPLPLIRKVATRISIVLSQFGFSGAPLEYFLLPLKVNRTFPRVGEAFAPKHINGAYTYRTNRKIYLYRAEEFPKVALHEACHHLPFHTDSWDARALMKLYTTLNIDSAGCPYQCTTQILPNEAVVEFWAEILHMCFLHAEYKVPLYELLQKEIDHGLLKSSMILQHQRRSFPKWKEDTHAYSYVVLRTVLLAHFDEFMQLTYPYDSRVVTDFMISKFRSPMFNKMLPRTNGSADMRMTVFGDS